MNSLEWINGQIEECKQSIQQSEIRIDEDKKYPSFVKCHKERIEELKQILKVLEQIKTELEAWEESKKYFILNEGCVPFYESTYEYITLKNDCIDESNSEEEGISIIKIKKALEKENVKNKR